MSYEKLGAPGLDYAPCRYGNSRLVFRGPARKLDGKYVAFLGSTETYGKFVEKSFPDLVEDATGTRCVNFGVVNAGVDAFANDPTMLSAARDARVTVIQAMGAHNMSNRFYTVHPRRNDRFVKPSQIMRSIFREVDFTEYHFTRHMLGEVCVKAPDRFAILRDELRAAWVARMRLLIRQIGGRIILLWFADHAPETAQGQTGLGSNPLMVDRFMLEELRPLVTGIVEVTASRTAMARRLEGLCFNELETTAAREMMGKMAHEEAARALARALDALV